MHINNDLYQHPKLITIFGGSGFIGRHVTETLIKEGFRVRVAVRFPEKAYAMQQLADISQLQMIRADVSNKAHIPVALEGASMAIYLAGSFHNKKRNLFKKLHCEGAQLVAEACQNLKLPLIHISALGERYEQDNSSFYQSKAKGEKLVRQAHPTSTILRPSLVYGPGDHFFTSQAKLATLPLPFPLVGHAEALFQPLYVRHLALFILALAKNKIPSGQIYELGGEEILSYREMITILLDVLNRKKTMLPIPSFLAHSFGKLTGLLGKLPLVPTICTSEAIRLLQKDSIVSKEAIEQKRILELIPFEPASLRTILPTYLWFRRPKGQFTKNRSQEWSR